MLKTILLSAVALASSATAACTREVLKASADAYVAAQTAGNPALVPGLTDTSNYTQNFKTTARASWILATPLKIDLSRSLLDTTQCATYTEIIVTDRSHPYVIGSQIHWGADGNSLSRIETLVSDSDDWLFNATGTMYYSSREKWDEIPEDKRDTRAAIQAGGDAYCSLFNDKSVKVPWGTPCNRLEGGSYTGRLNDPNSSCNVGVPNGPVLNQRRYVIDEVLGTVSIFLSFAGNPDSHEFRMEGGKLRYVHTITIMGRN